MIVIDKWNTLENMGVSSCSFWFMNWVVLAPAILPFVWIIIDFSISNAIFRRPVLFARHFIDFWFYFLTRKPKCSCRVHVTSQHKDDPGQRGRKYLVVVDDYLLCLNNEQWIDQENLSDWQKVFISYLKGQICEAEKGHINSKASNIFQTFMNSWQ